MHGYNDGIDEELYQGTAKAAEGIATSKAFSLAKEDSCEQVQSPDFRDSGIYGKTYSHLTLYIVRAYNTQRTSMKLHTRGNVITLCIYV